NTAGYYFKRQDIFMGKPLKHGETASVRLLRLAQKGRGEWAGKVHETWNIKGVTQTFHYPLLHSPHPTIESFLEKINLYTSLEAAQRLQLGAKWSLFQTIAYPLAKFLQNYFLRLGFLDGLP